MPRPYNKLRALMQEHEYDQVHIARILRRSPRYVWARLNNHASWELNDCYQLLKTFGLPPDKLTEVFPDGGRNEPIVQKRPTASLRLVRRAQVN